MITVYQINLTKTETDTINRDGWASVPVGLAKLGSTLGAKGWKDEFFKFYTPTMEVQSDDLEEVFELTNLWNDNSKINVLAQKRSSSVGDLFRDSNGDFHIVDTFGFKPLGKLE